MSIVIFTCKIFVFLYKKAPKPPDVGELEGCEVLSIKSVGRPVSHQPLISWMRRVPPEYNALPIPNGDN